MKTVLILAYDFPPYISAGALRPFSWYKYFHENNLFPVVITRQWGNKYGNQLDYIAPGYSEDVIIEKSESGIIIKTPYKPNLANRLMLKYGQKRYSLLRKSISAYYEFAQWICKTGPKMQIRIAAKDYLKNNKVDVILATGDPFILFNYASKLSKEFSVPWIADYRDIWSNDLNMKKKPIFRLWSKFFEKKIVNTASEIIMVSEFVKSKTYPLLKNKKIHVITNGYDQEVIEKVKLVSQNNESLNIGFAGSIFKWHPIERFLEGFELFLQKNPQRKIKLNFYGINIAGELSELIDNKFQAIKKHINIIAKMPYEQVISKLAENNALLLFNYYSFMGTKIYDYLGVKRKILLCFSNDAIANELKKEYYIIGDSKVLSTHLQEDLIKETHSGIVINDIFHLEDVLGDLCDKMEENGYIACESINTENYSRLSQIKKMSQIISNIK